MKTYSTEPKNYAGCNKIIKEFLIQNVSILCDVSNSYDDTKGQVYIVDYNPKIKFKYIDKAGMVWDKVKPIEYTYRIKKASDIIRWCEKKGWVPDDEGNFWNKDQSDNFCPEMFSYCGKLLSQVSDTWDWHDDWLERT